MDDINENEWNQLTYAYNVIQSRIEDIRQMDSFGQKDEIVNEIIGDILNKCSNIDSDFIVNIIDNMLYK